MRGGLELGNLRRHVSRWYIGRNLSRRTKTLFKVNHAMLPELIRQSLHLAIYQWGGIGVWPDGRGIDRPGRMK